MAGPEDNELTRSPDGTILAKAIQCRNCGANFTLRTGSLAMSVVCQACGVLLDLKNDEFRIINKVKGLMNETVIPIGTRGKLNNVEWEVVGYLTRKLKFDDFQWSEYLLFNPWRGYQWLLEFNGHWTLFRMLDCTIPSAKFFPSKIDFGGMQFDRFDESQASIVKVIGEFYWRVKVDLQAELWDYTFPPYLLSREKTDDEVIWSLGEYVDRKIIQNTFNIPSNKMPYLSGVGPNQPSPYQNRIKPLLIHWSIILLLLIVAQKIHTSFAPNEPVYSGYDISTPSTVTSPTFVISNGMTNLKVTSVANVDNSWVYLGGDLINEDTDQSFPFEVNVEYYHGLDSDGAWSEGSNTGSMVISSVPGGHYHIELETSGDKPTVLGVQVNRGVKTWSNFIWAIILVSIYPLWALYRRYQFEVDRWRDSAYTPYSVEDDDDS